MNLSIRSLFILLGVINLFISVLIIVNLFQLRSNNATLKEIEKNRFLMTQKADELRHTSDDLTRFVRTYAVTLDEKYKKQYFDTLNIRNGKDFQPKNYERIYWDLSEPLRSQRHPLLDTKVSLKKEMEELPYTEYELNKLEEAEANSNDLVNLEIESFNAIKGLYKDAEGAYTVKAQPNKKLAIDLLHSAKYHKAKEKIMLPIDEFLASLNERTEKSITQYNSKILLYTTNVLLLFFLALLILLFTFFIIKIKILRPIEKLSFYINMYENGDNDFEEKIYYKDEIGLITKQFFTMKHKLSEKYEIIKRISITDELTNIYNRKHYNEKISELLSLYKRYNATFSILMFDIDNFKHINDTYGHSEGDKVLVQIARSVLFNIRANDYFFRVGGEEFVILLSKTNLNDSIVVAEKIRKNIAELNIIENEKITVSLGLTEVQKDDNEDSIYKRVDELLYISKHNHKNILTAR